jgi:osmotically-inducible protein OsmY
VYDRALELLRDLIPETLEIGDPVPFRNRLFRIHVAEISGRFSVSEGGDTVAPTVGVAENDTADASADDSLREQVRRATAPFIRASGSALHVDVQDGVVVLGGTVADPRARASIEASIVQLPGVHALVQQLETGGPRTSELSPVEIAVRAIRALNVSPLPYGSNVTIVVDHGWLRVEGSISSPNARNEIRRRVENIPGARGFVDRMIVTPVSIPPTQRSELQQASATL